ncbi:MAG: OpgC domain-containing protein, partial [Candidatus Sericytochromatia bacterium]
IMSGIKYKDEFNVERIKGYKSKIEKSGWNSAVWGLFDRAFQLYKVNLFIIFSLLFIRKFPIFNPHYVMTFYDRVNNKVFNLFPDPNTDFITILTQVLTLKVGPHQTQILGLYVFLLMFSPIVLFFMKNGRTKIILTISWILYFINTSAKMRVTGAQFEHAFPLLTWQLIYCHGMAAGYHRDKLQALMETKYKKPILYTALFLFLCFMFWAQNTSNPNLPSWSRLSLVPPEFYSSIYVKYFQKNTLGLLRLVNYAVFLTTAFWFLTKYWEKANKWAGWFFIPIGQATLYVFIVHVYAVMIVSNFIPFSFDTNHLISNTIAHSVILFGLWLMVKNKMLYPWIPR